MVKNSFILVISQEKKEENPGSVEFQYSISPIRYEDLLHIWNCTEKTTYLKEVYVKFWENANDYCLICQR
uniref:Ribosomal protein S15 n=1 Tax=Afzelia bipindensis TaxID=162643 RepID=A0A8F3FMA2_9FABA|nr:ribosomal protein S15 [Afzelia bipindensis]